MPKTKEEIENAIKAIRVFTQGTDLLTKGPISKKTLKKAYLKLILKYHPDKNTDKSQATTTNAKLINEAWSTLDESSEQQIKDAIKPEETSKRHSQSSVGPKKTHGKGPNWRYENNAKKEPCGLQKEQSKQSYQDSEKAAFQDQLKRLSTIVDEYTGERLSDPFDNDLGNSVKDTKDEMQQAIKSIIRNRITTSQNFAHISALKAVKKYLNKNTFSEDYTVKGKDQTRPLKVKGFNATMNLCNKIATATNPSSIINSLTSWKTDVGQSGFSLFGRKNTRRQFSDDAIRVIRKELKKQQGKKEPTTPNPTL